MEVTLVLLFNFLLAFLFLPDFSSLSPPLFFCGFCSVSFVFLMFHSSCLRLLAASIGEPLLGSHTSHVPMLPFSYIWTSWSMLSWGISDSKCLSCYTSFTSYTGRAAPVFSVYSTSSWWLSIACSLSPACCSRNTYVQEGLESPW